MESQRLARNGPSKAGCSRFFCHSSPRFIVRCGFPDLATHQRSRVGALSRCLFCCNVVLVRGVGNLRPAEAQRALERLGCQLIARYGRVPIDIPIRAHARFAHRSMAGCPDLSMRSAIPFGSQLSAVTPVSLLFLARYTDSRGVFTFVFVLLLCFCGFS
jgi:hypothetical protein